MQTLENPNNNWGKIVESTLREITGVPSKLKIKAESPTISAFIHKYQ